LYDVQITFRDFVATEQQGLLRFAMVMSGNASEADDIVAEVMARTFVKWKRIEPMAQPLAYVRRMVVNEYLSGRRRAARVAGE